MQLHRAVVTPLLQLTNVGGVSTREAQLVRLWRCASAERPLMKDLWRTMTCVIGNFRTHQPYVATAHPIVGLKLLAAHRLPVPPAPLHGMSPPVRRRPLRRGRRGGRGPIVVLEVATEQAAAGVIHSARSAFCARRQHRSTELTTLAAEGCALRTLTCPCRCSEAWHRAR